MIWNNQLPYHPALDYRFAFLFLTVDEDSDDDVAVIKQFHFLGLDDAEHRRLVSTVDEHATEYDAFCDQMIGKYGDHDPTFSTGGHEEIAGFESSDIEPDVQDEVMLAWREFFTSRGFQCSDIETMDDDDYPIRYPNVVGVTEDGRKRVMLDVSFVDEGRFASSILYADITADQMFTRRLATAALGMLNRSGRLGTGMALSGEELIAVLDGADAPENRRYLTDDDVQAMLEGRR